MTRSILMLLLCSPVALGQGNIFAPSILTASAPAPAGYSDTFDGGSLDAKWTEYDPQGDISVSLGSGILTASIPAGVDHDLWTDTDHALRLRQDYSGSSDFILEAKFNTTMTDGYQIIGLIVETDNSNLAAFEIVYDVNGTHVATAAMFVDMAYFQESWDLSSVDTPPYYLRLEKSGTTYTCNTSGDGSSWTTETSFVWAGTVNRIGIVIGTAGGGSSPGFSATVDSFTYTAQ